jgi:hypothetical protein
MSSDLMLNNFLNNIMNIKLFPRLIVDHISNYSNIDLFLTKDIQV